MTKFEKEEDVVPLLFFGSSDRQNFASCAGISAVL